MTEKTCTFGPGLTGILSAGGSSGPLGLAPAVLMWNVGMNHRIGPYRIFVDLARRVDSLGGIAFRFDISGLGDSELHAGRGSDIERARLDIQEAMTFVEQRTGRRAFILIGFCSGVDSAHQVAMIDQRVAGVIQIEAYAYRSPGFYSHMYKRYLSRRQWERFLAYKWATLKTFTNRFRGRVTQERSTADDQQPVFVRDYPTREQYKNDIAQLARRNVRMLFVYVGAGTEYNYEGQFNEMYGSPESSGKVDVVYYERADHTFFKVSDRRIAIDAMMRWMKEKFSAT
jgi:hypothetical protein